MRVGLHGRQGSAPRIARKGGAAIARFGVSRAGPDQYSDRMQRLFSIFPPGAPGLALLLLRTSVGVMLFAAMLNREGPNPPSLLVATALLAAICLGLGLLTPYLAVAAGALAVANLLASPTADLVQVAPIVDALVLALLGPGAYSLDARLFGRRVTVVRPRKGAGSG